MAYSVKTKDKESPRYIGATLTGNGVNDQPTEGKGFWEIMMQRKRKNLSLPRQKQVKSKVEKTASRNQCLPHLHSFPLRRISRIISYPAIRKDELTRKNRGLCQKILQRHREIEEAIICAEIKPEVLICHLYRFSVILCKFAPEDNRHLP